MSLFDYKCEKCDRVCEKFFLRSEEIPNEIPCICEEEAVMKKQISTPAVHFKGRGFPTADLKRLKK